MSFSFQKAQSARLPGTRPRKVVREAIKTMNPRRRPVNWLTDCRRSTGRSTLFAFGDQRRLEHGPGVSNVVHVSGITASAGIAAYRSSRAIVVQSAGMFGINL